MRGVRTSDASLFMSACVMLVIPIYSVSIVVCDVGVCVGVIVGVSIDVTVCVPRRSG